MLPATEEKFIFRLQLKIAVRVGDEHWENFILQGGANREKTEPETTELNKARGKNKYSDF